MFDVITIGSATRDAFFEGLSFDYHQKDPHNQQTPTSLCLPLGAKIQASKVTFTTGGAGTNAAVTFARQGLRTATIVRVGNDVSGEEIRRNLQEEGIDTDLIQLDRSLPTSYSVILLAQGAERTILVFEGAGGHIEVGKIPWSTLETDWFYMDSIGGNEEILRGVVSLKQEKGVKLAWNPGTRDLALGLDRLKPYLSAFDIFQANQEEIAELIGIPYDQEKEIFKKLDELIGGIAIMTKGPKGVTVSDGKTVYDAGTFPENVLMDRTGAGDAFGSGFLVGYLRGGIQEGIKLASANGTSVVEQVGAKEGILRKEDITNERWNNLPINSYTL